MTKVAREAVSVVLGQEAIATEELSANVRLLMQSGLLFQSSSYSDVYCEVYCNLSFGAALVTQQLRAPTALQKTQVQVLAPSPL